VHVDLHQRGVADAPKAMDLPCLDHEDVTGPGLELLAVHRPEALSLHHELDFIVGMPVGPGTPAGKRAEQEDGDVHVAVVGPYELMGAALER